MVHIKSPYPDLPALPNCNVHHLFFKHPDQAAWPDYPVHINAETDERIMYSQMVLGIEHLSTGLATPLSEGGLGVASGDIVGIIGVNSTEYIHLIHACIRVATTFVPIASYSTAFELDHAFTLTNPTYLFVDENLLELVLPVAKKSGINNKNIFILKQRTKRTEVKDRKSCSDVIDDVKRWNIKTVDVRHATRDSLAYLIFSSGTSGLPKAVKISHGNLISTLGQYMVFSQVAAAIASPLAGIPVALGTLPLHHAYGLIIYCFRSCLFPSTLVFLPQWNIKLILELIPKYKISSLYMVPPVIYQIVNYPGIEKVDFSSITTVSSGASSLPPDVQLKIKKIIPEKAQFFEGYGMSETTVSAVAPLIDGGPEEKFKADSGSTGVLFPGMEGRIVREDFTDADANETGELWLRGPNITSGYWRNDEANRQSFRDGWLRTGDLFRVGKDGNLWFSDRLKDTLKVSGSQVSPSEIEKCLLSQPDKLIADAIVAGVSGGLTPDKIPRAWVVLSTAGKKLGKDRVLKILDAWHRENLSKHKHLRGGMEVVDKIPNSPTGKMLRRVLQAEYEKKSKQNNKSKL